MCLFSCRERSQQAIQDFANFGCARYQFVRLLRINVTQILADENLRLHLDQRSERVAQNCLNSPVDCLACPSAILLGMDTAARRNCETNPKTSVFGKA